ncbi:MAG: hypothetical protein PHV36_06070 [Elusimicrobiales bacterium]|nr:hypothetical protein [Elusimicrobiales bacterium]
MTMKKILAFTAFTFGVIAYSNAAETKPVYKWMAANEYYMIMPTAQTLNISGGGSESVKPWGFGFRAVGHETISKTGGLQFQSIKVDNPHTGKDTFYLFDLLLGMEYMTPKVQGKPLRFTAQAYADLGLSDTTLYAAPIISAGMLYTTNEFADTPTGFTFDIFYRLIDLDLDNVGGGKAGTLKPALGFKIGYIFEGFWTTKEKSAN